MKIKDDIQQAIEKQLEDEFSTAKSNASDTNAKFDKYYNMIHCIRSIRKNQWESNISLPEFTSRLLAQIGQFTTQYFGSRDFVENDMDSDDPVDIAEAKASKKLLNVLLNAPSAHYFHKIVRMLMFAFPTGHAYIKGGYDQKVDQVISHYETETDYMKDADGTILAEDGNPFEDITRQRPMKSEEQVPVYMPKIITDTPIFDVYPNNCVFESPEYCYSLNDKEYIYFEGKEVTKHELEATQEATGYFNLDKLNATMSDPTVKDKTYGRNDTGTESKEEPIDPISVKYTPVERWGLYPVLVKKRDEDGKPVDYIPGLDENGEQVKKSELLECIVTTARSADDETLIGFKISPHSERPMVKWVCYIDPLKDTGFGDGEVNAEIQTAIDDTFNVSQYRTMLATTPAFKAKRFAGVEEDVKVNPARAIMIDNIEDLQEFKIQDNILGAMQQHSMLTRSMDDSMGSSSQNRGLSSERKETATATVTMSQNANIRVGMKSMNLEFIGFTQFYRMILNLVNDFMLPETLIKLIGDDAYFYRPEREDKFKPVSQALESEESKQFKITSLQSLLGIVASVPNPKTPMAMNMIIGQILDTFRSGDFKALKKFLFSDDIEANMIYQIATGGGAGGQNQPTDQPGGGPQNQTGLPQSNREQQVRGAA